MAEDFKPLAQRMREKLADVRQNDATPMLNPDGTDPRRPSAMEPAPGKKPMSDNTEDIRATPKGTKLIKKADDEVIMTVRYVLQFWWPWLPIALLLFTIFGALPVGTAVGAFISDWQSNRIPGTIVVFVLGSIAATVLAFRRTRGEVTVIVHDDKIKFGDKVYDRRHFGGMRIGYTVESTDGSLKENFLDQQMGYAALRLRYGRWGEDLPYLVNKYHAPEIVIWMNELIDGVGAPPPKDIDASQGLRAQIF